MRMMPVILLGAGLLGLAACEAPLMSPERAAEVCEDRARAAQGPTGGVTLGVNSERGAYSAVEFGLSSDFLTGRDPVAVYEECVYQRSGMGPIRPPRLR